MRAQAGRNHPAVVGNQQIVGSQERANFAKFAMLDTSGRPLQHQQPAAIAWVGRLLGDEALRQFVVEKVGSHRESKYHWLKDQFRARECVEFQQDPGTIVSRHDFTWF